MNIPSWLPLLLGVLSAVGPLSTDMYLPAFPAIEHALGGQAGAAQITLAAWFAGLAFGQITQGTLSDRYGRRPPLIAGTILYTVASIGCALAPGLFALSAFRLLAAFGGSASMVITRAIVRDLADGHAAARLMSRLILVMGAAPILAPSLGGIILIWFGWQAIFWVFTAYGAGCAIAVAMLLPETLPEARRVRLGLGGMAARYVHIVQERGFLTNVLLGGCAMFGMFSFLAGSPPVFIGHFGLSPSWFGLLFGVCAACFIISAQINPRILPRFGPDRIIRVAVRCFLAATVVLVIAGITGWGGWLMVAAPIAVCMGSQGFTMPNSTVAALSRHAGHAGSASALMGTLQFGMAAVSGLLAGVLGDGTPLVMGLLMMTGALAATICDLCRPRRE